MFNFLQIVFGGGAVGGGGEGGGGGGGKGLFLPQSRPGAVAHCIIFCALFVIFHGLGAFLIGLGAL